MTSELVPTSVKLTEWLTISFAIPHLGKLNDLREILICSYYRCLCTVRGDRLDYYYVALFYQWVDMGNYYALTNSIVATTPTISNPALIM